MKWLDYKPYYNRFIYINSINKYYDEQEYTLKIALHPKILIHYLSNTIEKKRTDLVIYLSDLKEFHA